MISKIREPINSITHFIGAILSIVAFIFLLKKSINNDSLIQIISSTIFFLGLLGLYLTSSLYHGIIKNNIILEKWRKADHIMIYILIAASYTPICILTMNKFAGITMLIVIWTMSILGVIAKLFWFNMNRKFYTSLYLILGWSAIFAITPIYNSVGLKGILLLTGGGISYTIGAIIYAKKIKISIWKFRFHEIFHLFILLGSTLHFFMIYNYALK